MSFLQKASAQTLPVLAVSSLNVTTQLEAADVIYPAAPGTQGQVLAMGANDQLVFSDVAGEVLDAGVGITIANTAGTEIISVDPLTACSVVGAAQYSVAIGPGRANLGATTANTVSIGNGNLASATGPSSVVAIGSANLPTVVAGQVAQTIAIGVGNLGDMDVAYNNIAIGSQCLQGLKAAGSDFNIGIGNVAGETLLNGEANIAIGNSAMGTGAPTSTAQSNNNIAMGYQALAGLTISTGYGDPDPDIDNSAGANIAIGFRSLVGTTTGVTNVGIGYEAADFLTTGTDNVFIGTNAGASLVTGNDNVVIGGDVCATRSNTNAVIPAAGVDGLVSLGNTATTTALMVGYVTSPILEANTQQFGLMSSTLEMCPKQLSYGSIPTNGIAGDFNVSFPTEAEIAAVPGLGTGFLLGVDSITNATASTPAIVNMTYLNPTVVNVQEVAEFPLFMTPTLAGYSALGGPRGPYSLEGQLGEHSATVQFTRTGNVVQCQILGNTPAINWTIGNDHHTPTDGEVSTVNTNYFSAASKLVLETPLTNAFEYNAAIDPAMDGYGKIVALLTVGPASDPDNAIISSLLAPAFGTTYSQDFDCVPVRAYPEAGTTSGGHWLKFTPGETYLGACYNYSALPANAAGSQTGYPARIRLTVSSFMGDNDIRYVGVSILNVSHYSTAANYQGVAREAVDFNTIYTLFGTSATPGGATAIALTGNAIIRVQPQGIPAVFNDTDNNEVNYMVMFPENYEDNSTGTENLKLSFGGGEPKLALTYIVVPE